MAQTRAVQAVKALEPASTTFAVGKKYTVQSYGVWEGIRRVLAVDPTRSTGVPLNSQFRNPPPGANPPGSYDDPVTVPSGDIAENPYYKRDIRRSYPRPSVLTQADITGLLTVGSSAMPIEGTLQTGEAGAKQLIEIKEGRGLSEVLRDKNLSSGGLPPNPAGLHRQATEGRKGYTINKNNGFPERQVSLSNFQLNAASLLKGWLAYFAITQAIQGLHMQKLPPMRLLDILYASKLDQTKT